MDVQSSAGGRLYFAVQALAGAAWWVGVVVSPLVRVATLGPLPPLPVAIADIPLFVLASAAAAGGWRAAAVLATAWTSLVTAAMVVVATVTGQAGLGAVAMVAATAGSLAACSLVLTGRLPTERVLVGPLRFRTAAAASPGVHLRSTVVQLVLFWTFFLLVAPLTLSLLERRWGVDLPLPAGVGPALDLAGMGVILAGSALGLASAFTMARRGHGTPLPGRMANMLVTAGPYGWVRNPMAVAGFAQVVGVGMVLGSWAVIAVAIVGTSIWHHTIRPAEEADLAARFGAAYELYRSRVGLWIPRPPTP